MPGRHPSPDDDLPSLFVGAAGIPRHNRASASAMAPTIMSGSIHVEMTLTAEHLAQLIVQSIDRHGLRGLIYEADGMTDVVMHGKVDMVAVARDVIAAMAEGMTED